MIKGELYINGQDAWLTWGAFLDDASISALMTPAATKEFVKNNSRLEHGTRYITTNPKLKERDFLCYRYLTAPDGFTVVACSCTGRRRRDTHCGRCQGKQQEEVRKERINGIR